jgi:hypothetical protein
MDAVVLNNWFPRAGECQLRGGSANFATGMTGEVKSLFQYNTPGTTEKFFAVTDAGVYDITAGGAVGAAAKSLTNGYIHGVTLTNSAGSTYYWFANGVDKPVVYDGSTWTSLDGSSSPAITGVTTTAIVYPWLFKHRIFFIEKSTMNMYYLPVDSIAGAASKFPLGNLFQKGGALKAGTSWTLDSGTGPDDLLVVITNHGELAIYKGINPASASSWEIVGVWDVGRPLSRRCFFKFGGDVGVLVDRGFFLLSKLLQTGSVNYSAALSVKIQPTVSKKAQEIGTATNGWEGCAYPQYDALIINIPAVGQYVMNTTTGAWCSFTGWDAKCFSVKDGLLYFGSSGGVVKKAWDGLLTSDDGASITSACQLAWSYYGNRTMLKNLVMFRPLLAWDGAVSLNWGVGAEYADFPLTSYYPADSANTPAVWGTALWGVSSWQASLVRYKNWMSAVHPPGYALSLYLQTTSNDSNLTWSGTDFILERGGIM